jgi:hypothetical protein
MIYMIEYTIENVNGAQRLAKLSFGSEAEMKAAIDALETVLRDLRGIWTLKDIKAHVLKPTEGNVYAARLSGLVAHEAEVVPIKKKTKPKVYRVKSKDEKTAVVTHVFSNKDNVWFTTTKGVVIRGVIEKVNIKTMMIKGEGKHWKVSMNLVTPLSDEEVEKFMSERVK